LKQSFKENPIKNRTMATIAILAAIMMTVSVANVDFARGDRGRGGRVCSGQSSVPGSGAALSQMQKTPTAQSGQHKTHPYRQSNGNPAARSEKGQKNTQQVQLRTRTQLRAPATHASAPSE
jgi:hypothetical protein